MLSSVKSHAPATIGAQIHEGLAARTKDDPVFSPEFGVQAELPRWALSGERSVMKSHDGHPMMVTEWRVENPRATLVLFQGRGESAFRWEEPARIFNRAGVDVVTVDWPGQGLSGRFADGNVHHADVRTLVSHGRHFIETLAKQGRLTGPVTLHGYSMGGCVAAALAANPPVAVDRLVLHQPMTDFHRKVVSDGSPTVGRLLDVGVRPSTLAGLTGAMLCLRSSQKTAPSWGTEEYLIRYLDYGPWLSVDDSWRLRRERRAARIVPSMNVGGFTWGATVSATKLIRQVSRTAHLIDRKTLIISGEKDRVVCNDSHKQIHQKISGSRHVVIADAGHAAHLCQKPARRAYFDAVIPFALGG
ncbi:MAG: alpha/beta hydrolase [Myxococcota bacterium]